jgi:hypothetical protein
MTLRGWVGRALTVVVLAVVVNVLLDRVSRRHDVVLVTLAVVCVVAALGVVVEGTGATPPVNWSVERLADTRPARTEATLASYERLLERQWTSREPDTALQERLLWLAGHRLAQTHRTEEREERLRAVLGPGLDLLVDPRPRRLTPTQIGRIIDRIEEL